MPNHEGAVHVEARWTTESAGSTGAEGETWQRLFSFPLCSAKALSKHLVLIHAGIEPAAACPGDTVNIVYTWRCLGRPDEKLGIHTQFVDSAGEVAFEYKHVFFRHPEDSKGKFMVTGKLRKGFRFSEPFWVTLPRNMKPGTFELRVGLYDRKRPEEAVPPVNVGFFDVARTPRGAFHRLVKQDTGLDHFKMLGSDALLGKAQVSAEVEKETTSRLAQLGAHHSDEGQFDYLMAMREEDASRRDAQLRACLEKVPWHREALALAAEQPWGEAFKKKLEAITPPNACRFDLQGLFRLFGYEAKLSPIDAKEPAVYLTLYWEALASMTRPYSTGLTIGYYGPRDFKSTHWIWWFMGAALRPTYHWKIGEVIKETVYIPLLDRLDEVSFALKPDSHWHSLYTEKLNPLELHIHDEAESKRKAYAHLGRFKVVDLPYADEDLLKRKRETTPFYQLYDLQADPLERNNLIDVHPEIFHAMKPRLLAAMETAELPLEQPPGEEEELSEETLEALRQLGYIK
jgi:hypothetical protein